MNESYHSYIWLKQHYYAHCSPPKVTMYETSYSQRGYQYPTDFVITITFSTRLWLVFPLLHISTGNHALFNIISPEILCALARSCTADVQTNMLLLEVQRDPLIIEITQANAVPASQYLSLSRIILFVSTWTVSNMNAQHSNSTNCVTVYYIVLCGQIEIWQAASINFHLTHVWALLHSYIIINYINSI